MVVLSEIFKKKKKKSNQAKMDTLAVPGQIKPGLPAAPPNHCLDS